MIVDVTISCRSFVFSQSRAKVSAGFRQIGNSIQEQMLRLRATYIGEISTIENLQRT